MKRVILLLVLLSVLVSGCAVAEIKAWREGEDGKLIEYRAVIRSFGQDFSASDLAATLDPAGKTTVKAGAVDNTTSQVTADVAKVMAEMFIAILPYIANVPAAP